MTSALMKTMNDLPRTDLGPYRLQRLLGRGGMGAVYLAVDQRLGRDVAVKHLPPTEVENTQRRHRLRREASTLARLSHPSIVQIFDLVEAADGDWIVMEHIDGPSVAELLANGPLPLTQALEIGRQIAEGLGAAHELGILHRDLKAENVMLQRTGHAKILDFGLAKVLQREPSEPALSGPGQIVGTSHAMSPEQAKGGLLDPRTDLFSLGILLYEMTSGELPFRGPTGLDTLRLIVGHPHRPARALHPEIPAPLSNLFDRLLEKSPEHRPASAQEVAAELAEIAADLRSPRSLLPLDRSRNEETTLDAQPAVQPARFKQEASRYFRRPIALGALLIAGLVIVLVAQGWRPLERQVIPDERLPAAEPAAEDAVGAGAYPLFREGMEWLGRTTEPGHLDRAIAFFEAALGRDETSAAAHAGLALAYRRQYRRSGDSLHLEQALAVAEQAVRLDEHLALAWIALATTNTLAGRPEEALDQLTTALQLEPSNAEAHRGLGELHRREERFDEAIDAYEQAIRLAPRDYTLRSQLGQLYYRMARYQEAEEQILSGLRLEPERAEGYRDLSAVRYMQGRLGEAAEALQKALAIRPEHSLYSNLGTILFAQGLYPPAARAYEKALQHGGANFYLYWANLADTQRLMTGHEEASRESYREAIELLQQKIEKTPEKIVLRSRLALYWAKRGDRGEALIELAEIARLGGSQAEDLYRIAVAYEVCGERRAALEALAAALQAGYPAQQVRDDPELFALRADPAYRRAISDDGGGPLGSPKESPITISGSTR